MPGIYETILLALGSAITGWAVWRLTSLFTGKKQRSAR